ncbi:MULTISPECIES: amidohydrolase family protein [Streptomyces violaceusniger group]|uniref:Amidohydrolase-related domain-containing protein n=2 Tax=Streptomyces rhizosphaericus TaxID=114699 RepID=A0ABN1RNE2_9ACTN|nr:amidohydrolase family protein [Streptomyces rhizosphaericus]
MTTGTWVDVHAHFTPPATEEQRHTAWTAMRELCFLAPQPYHWTVEGALRSMDRTGVAMQLLSAVPQTHDALRTSNDYGAELVTEHPGRFGLLAALPTDDPQAALTEITRAEAALRPDGWAVSTTYNGINLSDRVLEPVWEELNRRSAVVFVHPDTTKRPELGLPTPLVEVAFDTTRTIVAMLYQGMFRRYPDVRFVLAHCGGALPGLSGRLRLLGTEAWVPAGDQFTPEEIAEQLSRLYLDTAASGTDANLAAALTMVPVDHIVYGGDAGVPCSDDRTLSANITALRKSSIITSAQAELIGRRALELFPAIARRSADRVAGL